MQIISFFSARERENIILHLTADMPDPKEDLKAIIDRACEKCEFLFCWGHVMQLNRSDFYGEMYGFSWKKTLHQFDAFPESCSASRGGL